MRCEHELEANLDEAAQQVAGRDSIITTRRARVNNLDKNRELISNNNNVAHMQTALLWHRLR